MSGRLRRQRRFRGTVYEILDHLFSRPHGVVPELCRDHPLEALETFLDGLAYAELDQGDPPFCYFVNWAQCVAEVRRACGPWHLLADQQEAYGQFMQYLRDYRTCSTRVVARPVKASFLAGFEEYAGPGLFVPPAVPIEIHIGQFWPSKVFYLAERYEDGEDFDLPFWNSVNRALDAAWRKWRVPPEAWRSMEAH